MVQTAINQLLTSQYNGHTEDSVRAELSLLRYQLEQINQTLDNVTLEESDVQELENILVQVSTSTLLGFNLLTSRG